MARIDVFVETLRQRRRLCCRDFRYLGSDIVGRRREIYGRQVDHDVKSLVLEEVNAVPGQQRQTRTVDGFADLARLGKNAIDAVFGKGNHHGKGSGIVSRDAMLKHEPNFVRLAAKSKNRGLSTGRDRGRHGVIEHKDGRIPELDFFIRPAGQRIRIVVAAVAPRAFRDFKR